MNEEEQRRRFEESKKAILDTLDGTSSAVLKFTPHLADYVRQRAHEGDTLAADLINAFDVLWTDYRCASIAGHEWVLDQQR